MQPDDTVRIPLRAHDGTVRAYTLVDAADAEWVNQWRWYLNGRGYATRHIPIQGRSGSLPLHRALLRLTYGDGRACDHINRDRLDNRRSNLRAASPRENGQNKPSVSGSSSRYRGVTWNKDRQKWQAEVKTLGKHHYLGLFLDEDEAGRVAQDARRRLLPFASN